MIDNQRGRNAKAKDESVCKVFAGNRTSFAQQHAQNGGLAIRVRRITTAVQIRKVSYIEATMRISIIDQHLRSQFLAQTIEVFDQARFLVRERIERVFSVIGAHAAGADAAKR